MPFADIDAARIHYRLHGAGPPVALILPQSTGPTGRSALIEGLARAHCVLTFDQRGTGGSDEAPAHQDMASMAGDLGRLLDELAFERVHLVCHSTGCGVGLSLAAAWRQRVAGLVLCAPWTHGDPYLSAMQNLRKAAAAALDPEQYARFNAALLFPPRFRRDHADGFSRQALQARDHPQDAPHLARRLDAILAFDARTLWSRVRCPTLVIAALDDQLMPPWFARETAAGIEGAQLREFDDAGHMLPETRTPEFVREVSTFLDGTPA